MKILIVDDSALIRSILKQLFKADEGLAVAGEASNGRQALIMNRKLEPDIIIMDILMPLMGGLEAVRRIMKDRPVPILIFANDINKDIRNEAIRSGAVEVMEKPGMDEFNEPEFYLKFIRKIRFLAGHETLFKPEKLPKKINVSPHYKLLVMGASTGGPMAVRTILENLPKNFPIGIALVQHMESGFDRGYARWLNELSDLEVRLADSSVPIQPGIVYVSPVDKHLIVKKNFLITDDGPKVLNQKPSVDILFKSAAESFGDRIIGVLLTGMGRDGASGCVSILSRGGITLVQNEKTSAIFGMPKSAIEMGGASKILPLEKIPEYIIELLGISLKK